MKIIDTITVKRFAGRVPAIAYTDARFVYLSWNLSGREYELAHLHECSHIWLSHHHRENRLVKNEGGEINRNLWLIATDLEIAKHLYTPGDTITINRPRSELNGGVTHEDTLKYPTCSTAEDFYHELKKHDDIRESTCCQTHKDNEIGEQQIENVEGLIEKAKQNLKELQRQKKGEDTQQTISSFRPPKPSLSSEIDRYLGRSKVEPVASYRRPYRRETHDTFIRKGKINRSRTPHFTLYVDRSGSFDSQKTARATALISTVLKKYRGRVTQDVIYFNDKLMVDDPKIGAGGTNYTAVVDNIIKDQAHLSLIITDDDSYTRPENLPKLPKTIVLPVGAQHTEIAKELKLIEV